MIRPVTYPSLTRARILTHYDAAQAVHAWNDAACALIDRQAHARLCFELRDLAARIVIEPGGLDAH